jgi:ATP-dependent DNA ligase I
MNLSSFVRFCESIEYRTPTEKIKRLGSLLTSTEDKASLISILSLDYPPNNIGSKRAIEWIAKSLNVFDDEIITSQEIWDGDLGQGVWKFVGDDSDYSNYTIKQFYQMLNVVCSKLDSSSFDKFDSFFSELSGLEMKWFIRYWTRTPNNGILESTLIKALNLYYPQHDIVKFSRYNSLKSIVTYLESGKIPPMKLDYCTFIKPSLAKKLNNNLPENYTVDIKYDGNRYQLHRNDNGDMTVFNRKGKIVTEQFTDIVEEVDWNGSFIIDTEIYPVDIQGNPAPHSKLGTRVHSKDKEKAIRDCPVKLIIFDVISINGESCLEKSYRERINILKDNFDDEYITEFLSNDIDTAYNYAISGGYEGIMIKDLDSEYKSGRTNSILKHKPTRINLDVVITSAEYGTGKNSQVMSSFGISVVSDNGYTEIGKVGLGFTEMQLFFLTNELRKIVDKYAKEVFYVLPRIVVEVEADLVTQNKDGTYGLRFPRFIRIRDDKYPTDCNTLEDVKEMI